MGVSKGWSSYASLLEHRIITQTWSGYHRTKGKFIFRRIQDESSSEDSWNRDTIGFEMVTSGYAGRYRQRTGSGEFIFQCYHDGTALYKKNKLGSVMYHYQAKHDINEVIDHYYNVDTQLVPNIGDRWENQRETVIVLRRKPISAVAKSLYAQGRNLGDFLVNKYNMREGVAANV